MDGISVARAFYGFFALVACAGVAACGSSEGGAPVGGEQVTKAPEQVTNAPPIAVMPEGKDVRPALSRVMSVQEFIGQMDDVGPGSKDRYDAALANLRKDPSAFPNLKAFYSAQPKTALGTRWKAVHLAGEFENLEATNFLQDIALARSESALAAYDDFRLKYSAAVGVVRAHSVNVAEAQGKVERLLTEADTEIAELVGLELFSRGILTEALRTRLKARGIAANYRLPTDAEVAAMRKAADPAIGARSPESAARLKTMTVPAYTEGVGEK